GGNQDRRADRKSCGAVEGLQLGGDVTLVVQHDDECICTLFAEHRVGAKGTGYVDSIGGSFVNGRRDDVDLLTAEHSLFAGVRVETADEDLRPRDAELLERCIGDTDHALDPLARYQRDRFAHADMQSHVYNAGLVEADHQIDVIDSRAAFARDK